MRDSFLDRVRVVKEAEVAARKRETPPADMRARVRDAPAPRAFAGALALPGISVIAEVKRSSPSSGKIAPGVGAVSQARAYAAGGAAAVSVLTDGDFFGGSIEDLVRIRESVNLPLLRKDFVFDPYQVQEARAAGADAVLLIAEFLSPEDLRRLRETAEELGMGALVEVHGERELGEALRAGANILGINNRDLRSLEVDISRSLELLPLVPGSCLKVAESGVSSREQVELMERAGADAILVGEALMRSPDPAGTIRRLRGEIG